MSSTTRNARKIPQAELPTFEVFLTKEGGDARADFADVKAKILEGVPTIQGQPGATGATGPKGDTGEAGSEASIELDTTQPNIAEWKDGKLLVALNNSSRIQFNTQVLPDGTVVRAPNIVVDSLISQVLGNVLRKEGDSFYVPAVAGAKGDKGDTGDTGATGPQGAKGDKGDAGSGTAVDKFDMQYAKKIDFTKDQQLQIANLETLFRRNVSATVLEGFYIGYFSLEGTNPLTTIEPFLAYSAILNYAINGGSSTTMTVKQDMVVSFRYVNNVLTEVEVLNDGRLIQYLAAQMPTLPTVYEIARDAATAAGKNVSGLIKAAKTGATVTELDNVLGSKKGFLVTLTDPAADIRYIKLFFGALQTACDTDDHLYIALKVNVPTAVESEYGRKSFPEIPNFKTTAGLAFPASVNNPRTALDNGLAQRELLVEPATAADYILYRIQNVAQLGAGEVSFTSF